MPSANVNKAALHIGCSRLHHRFGSSLNEHVHFHVCVVDGMFENGRGGSEQAPHHSDQRHVSPAIGIDPRVTQAQASLRRHASCAPLWAGAC